MKRNNGKKFGIIILLLTFAALALSGCSGGNGASGPAGPAGATGATGKDAAVNISTLSAEELASLSFSTTASTVSDVTIASPPVVTFKVADANGTGIKGLGFTTKSNTTGLTGLSNIGFTLAKLMPGPNGSPDYWVSYIVTSMPYTNTSGTFVPAAAARPTTDTNGTLVDNGDGTYEYTFGRDIAKAKDVAGVNPNPPYTDVTYEPTRTHRLVIQIGGAVRGTGTNNSDGTNTPTGLPTTYFKNPMNLVFDFTIDPVTGKAKALTANDLQRVIVKSEKCFECHGKFAHFHGGVRQDTRFCVTCHTDQRRIGQTASTEVNGTFTGPIATSGSLAGQVVTYIVDDRAIGNFPNYIHKIHMGHRLTKQGYNFAGVKFNEVGLPQDVRDCRKCHEASTSPSGSDWMQHATPQGDNWKTKPSRLVCGACHDGIDFATGNGTTVEGATTGHAGGPQADDSRCALCHEPGFIDIDLYHTTDNATPKNPNVPEGAVNFIYEISSVTVDSTSTAGVNKPVVKFRIKSYTGSYSEAAVAAATPVTLNTPGGTTLLDGFTGGPSFVVGWGALQDGKTTAVDYNNTGSGNTSPQGVSVSLLNVWNGTQGVLTGPDGSGYYTATLTGTANAGTFPAGAGLRTVALQSYFTQVSPAVARHAISVVGYVSGETRREVVDMNNCAKCHEWLELHGGSRVKDIRVCIICHNPNLSSSGRGADVGLINAFNAGPVGASLATVAKQDGTGNYTGTVSQAAYDAAQVLVPALGTNTLLYPEAGMHFKNLIHSIHSANFREENSAPAFKFVRDRSTSGIYYYDFSEVTFPGVLNNCETCHKPGTYAVEAIPADALTTTYVTTGVAGASVDKNGLVSSAEATALDVVNNRKTVGQGTDLVTTPVAATCLPCHNSDLPRVHMTGTGGAQIAVRRDALVAGSEQCVLCHGRDRVVDVNVVHKK